MPHSPIPDVHGNLNPVFGSAAFNGPLNERQDLQTLGLCTGSSATPDRHQKTAGKMQRKGYLQSRRMPSREDLNHHLSDLHVSRV